jgi:CRISPR-associated endonuclease/helicase Cas3
VALYGDAEDLVELYHNQPAKVLTKEKVRLIRQMQQYSVSLYEWELLALSKQQSISVLDDETGILILDKNHYSNESGVVLEIIQENLII